jgi:nucleotide-binding universal stress UspA family protein
LIKRQVITMLKPTKILVPVDFSDYSAKAIQYGAEFARTFDAELVICHVLEMPVYPVSVGMGSVPPIMAADVMPDVKRRLETTVAESVGDGLEVTQVIREGTPFVEIVQLAKSAGVDLIVMPTHGRTGISHLIIGSTAERVVRKAPCPVLVVRDEEREFVHP